MNVFVIGTIIDYVQLANNTATLGHPMQPDIVVSLTITVREYFGAKIGSFDVANQTVVDNAELLSPNRSSSTVFVFIVTVLWARHQLGILALPHLILRPIPHKGNITRAAVHRLGHDGGLIFRLVD